jgi:cbb3-type cytochrome oxidase maturation protein
MDVLVYLIPIALMLGLGGLAAFLWSMKSGQFDDLEGAAYRILFDDEDEEAPDRRRDEARPDDARPDDARRDKDPDRPT